MVRQDDELARTLAKLWLDSKVNAPYLGLVVETDELVAGVLILNDYYPGDNIEVTAAAVGPWSIADVRGVARYCFQRARRITARTKTTNERAIKMLEALGFKREGVMREYFAGDDAMVFGLLRSEQRICKL